MSQTPTRATARRAFPYIRTRAGQAGGCPVRPRPGKTPGYQSHAPNLAESDGTGPVAVGLLDATGGGGGLASRLGGELLAGGLASGGLAGGLLGTSHVDCVLGCDGRTAFGQLFEPKNSGFQKGLARFIFRGTTNFRRISHLKVFANHTCFSIFRACERMRKYKAEPGPRGYKTQTAAPDPSQTQTHKL